MKKTKIAFISLMLLMSCCLCFAGCGGAGNEITEKDWNEIISASNFENYTITCQSDMVITMQGNESPMNFTSEETVKFTNDKIYRSVSSTMNGQISTSDNTVEGEEAKSTRSLYANMFSALKYDLFDFNAETNQYVAKQTIEVPVQYTYFGASTSNVSATQSWENVVVEITGGKLGKITYETTVMSEELGTSTVYKNVYILSDYGTTTK